MQSGVTGAPAVEFIISGNKEHPFPNPSGPLAAFRKEEKLCECETLCDSGNRNQKFT